MNLQLYNYRGQPNGVIIFDDKDSFIARDFKWHKTNRGYAATWRNGHSILFHRMILKLNKESEWVDHKNLNRLDNRRSNLRIVNASQNNMNKRIQKNNNSGTRGVYLKKCVRNGIAYYYWTAEISVGNKTLYLGMSKHKKPMINLRKEAEKKYFKEYAYNAI